MLGTSPNRSGANASGIVIGVPGEHLFLARRNRAGESIFLAARYYLLARGGGFQLLRGGQIRKFLAKRDRPRMTTSRLRLLSECRK